jgi:hypothetical protein
VNFLDITISHFIISTKTYYKIKNLCNYKNLSFRTYNK